jgi:hypothetical protein
MTVSLTLLPCVFAAQVWNVAGGRVAHSDMKSYGEAHSAELAELAKADDARHAAEEQEHVTKAGAH